MLAVAQAATEMLREAQASSGFASLCLSSESSMQCGPILILLKPELVGQSRILFTVVSEVAGALSRYGTFVRLFAFSGEFARLQGFVEQNWYVLSLVSRRGQRALDLPTNNRLASHAAGRSVVGGHELIDSGAVCIDELELAVRSANTNKIGAGIYSTNIHVGREAVCVLNGFHPMQYQRFVAREAMWLAFEFYPSVPLAMIRNEVIGVEPPKECKPATLKRRMYDLLRAKIGIEMTLATNGFHCSPNYLDAALGLRSLCGGNPRESALEQLGQGMIERANVSLWNDLEDVDFAAASAILLQQAG